MPMAGTKQEERAPLLKHPASSIQQTSIDDTRDDTRLDMSTHQPDESHPLERLFDDLPMKFMDAGTSMPLLFDPIKASDSNTIFNRATLISKAEEINSDELLEYAREAAPEKDIRKEIIDYLTARDVSELEFLLYLQEKGPIYDDVLFFSSDYKLTVPQCSHRVYFDGQKVVENTIIQLRGVYLRDMQAKYRLQPLLGSEIIQDRLFQCNLVYVRYALIVATFTFLAGAASFGYSYIRAMTLYEQSDENQLLAWFNTPDNIGAWDSPNNGSCLWIGYNGGNWMKDNTFVPPFCRSHLKYTDKYFTVKGNGGMAAYPLLEFSAPISLADSGFNSYMILAAGLLDLFSSSMFHYKKTSKITKILYLSIILMYFTGYFAVPDAGNTAMLSLCRNGMYYVSEACFDNTTERVISGHHFPENPENHETTGALEKATAYLMAMIVMVKLSSYTLASLAQVCFVDHRLKKHFTPPRTHKYRKSIKSLLDARIGLLTKDNQESLTRNNVISAPLIIPFDSSHSPFWTPIGTQVLTPGTVNPPFVTPT